MWRNLLVATLAILILAGSASAIVTLPEQSPEQSSSLTPGQVVQEFLLDLDKGGENIAKFVTTSQDVKRELSMAPILVADFMGTLIIKHNTCVAKISKIHILKETSDQTTARVKAKIVCRDGSTRVNDYLLVPEFGSWKIDFSSLLPKAIELEEKAVTKLREKREAEQTMPRPRSRKRSKEPGTEESQPLDSEGKAPSESE